MRSAWKNKFLPIKDQQKKPCECFRSPNLIFLSGVFSLCLTPSTAVKIRPKFLNMKLFDQNQQPLKSVKPFERILRALFISQCPYKFSSFLDLRNTSDRFRLFVFVCLFGFRRPMYVSFIGLRLTKTSLTLINRTRLRTKSQSASYPQAQIGTAANWVSFDFNVSYSSC